MSDVKLSSLSRYWKTIIAVVGLTLTVLTSLEPVWGDNLPSWVPVAIAVLTSVSVYLKANTPPAGQPADPNVSETDPTRVPLITPGPSGVQPLDEPPAV